MPFVMARSPQATVAIPGVRGRLGHWPLRVYIDGRKQGRTRSGRVPDVRHSTPQNDTNMLINDLNFASLALSYNISLT